MRHRHPGAAALQVRADVRLEDVPLVQPGQPVRIETPSVTGGALDGEVLFATGLANIQKNTLEIKIALKSPPEVLRPDMLVQATFLAPPRPGGVAAASERLRLLIPRQCVEIKDGSPRVWVADPTAGRARLTVVRLGAAAGDVVEVLEGLGPSDKVIAHGREGLRDGTRILIVGEEPALGTAAGRASSSEFSRLPTPQPGPQRRP